MASTELRIEGMSCGHCVSAVKKALEAVDGVTAVEVEVGRARVEADPARAGRARLARAIEDEGYRVVG